MTKEDYKLLKEKYSKHLAYAKNGVSMGLTLDESKELFELYNRLFNAHERNYSCPSCRMIVYEGLNKAVDEYESNKTKTKKKK